MNKQHPVTGRMQFGNDLPGVYIRSGDAVHLGLMIKAAADTCTLDPIYKSQLELLSETLFSCDLREHLPTQKAHLLEPLPKLGRTILDDVS